MELLQSPTQIQSGVYLLVKTTAEGGVIIPAGLVCPQYIPDGEKCKYRDYRNCYAIYNSKPLMVPNMAVRDEDGKVFAEYKTQDGSCTWKIYGEIVKPKEVDGNILWFDTEEKWGDNYYSYPDWGEFSKIDGKVGVLDKKLFYKFNNFTFNSETHLFYPKKEDGFLPNKGEHDIYINSRELPYNIVKITKVEFPNVP